MLKAFVCGLGLLTSGALGQTTQPTSQPSSTVDSGSAATPAALPPALFDAAQSDVAIGDYRAAIEKLTMFQASLKKSGVRVNDPVMVNSTHVLGIARMRLGQWKPAADAFQRIYPALTTNRSILINTSIVDIQQNGDMLPRALKNLQAFCVAHPNDEPAVNLWGAALDKLAEKAHTSMVNQSESAYVKAVKLLEATRPGMRRWGTDWLSADEVASKEKERTRQQANVDSAQRDVNEATRKLNEAKDRYNQASARRTTVVASGDVYWVEQRRREEMDDAERSVRTWQGKLDDRTQTLNAEVAKMPRPTWAVAMDPVAPEFVR